MTSLKVNYKPIFMSVKMGRTLNLHELYVQKYRRLFPNKVLGCGRNKSRRNYDILCGISEGKEAGFVEECIVNGKRNKITLLNVDCSMPLN
jgi:hypothetical protein